MKEIKGHKEEIRNLRWSNDGTMIATAADALRIWDRDGRLLHTGFSEENLWGVAWSRDDLFIVTGSFGGGKVQLWNKQARLVKQIAPVH